MLRVLVDATGISGLHGKSLHISSAAYMERGNQAPDGPAAPSRFDGVCCTSHQVTSIPSASRVDERPYATAYSVSHDWRLTRLCMLRTALDIYADCIILALLNKFFAIFLDPLRECARPLRTPLRRGGAFGDLFLNPEHGLAT